MAPKTTERPATILLLRGLPPIICLALYWQGLFAWFRDDDFAWFLWHPGTLREALFGPAAQGTIRTLSERLFLMGGYRLFGLHAFPFHLIVFLTHLANLW